jgi:hypothetical protein
VAKSAGFGEEDGDDWQQELVAKVKALAGVRPRQLGIQQ